MAEVIELRECSKIPCPHCRREVWAAPVKSADREGYGLVPRWSVSPHAPPKGVRGFICRGSNRVVLPGHGTKSVRVECGGCGWEGRRINRGGKEPFGHCLHCESALAVAPPKPTKERRAKARKAVAHG